MHKVTLPCVILLAVVAMVVPASAGGKGKEELLEVNANYDVDFENGNPVLGSTDYIDYKHKKSKKHKKHKKSKKHKKHKKSKKHKKHKKSKKDKKHKKSKKDKKHKKSKKHKKVKVCKKESCCKKQWANSGYKIDVLRGCLGPLVPIEDFSYSDQS